MEPLTLLSLVALQVVNKTTNSWLSGVAVACQRVRFQDSRQGDNPGQQLYHTRAQQLGELGLPGCDEALSGMGGASLTNEVPGVM